MASTRHRLVIAHVALVAIAGITLWLATMAMGASRDAVEDADRITADLLVSHRVAAETRALASATWRYVLDGSPTELARVRDHERTLARVRAPLEDRPDASELLDAIEAAAATTAWARDEGPSTTLTGTALRAQLARIATELEGATWRLDAALVRHLERTPRAETWPTWQRRAVIGLFAFAVLATLASAIVVGRELAHQARRGRETAHRGKQLERQRQELLHASRDIHDSLGAIAQTAADLGGASAVTIASTATRVDDLLTQLFDVTRVELGETSLRREYCDSRTLVLAALRQHEAHATGRAIRLRSDAAAATPVLADRERIGQVLTTLIERALKPAPAGAEIVVTTEPQARAIRFVVTDVTPRVIPEAFELRRAAAPAAFELYTCRRLVEAHGGNLGVDRTEGHPHTYWFTLPNEPRLLR